MIFRWMLDNGNSEEDRSQCQFGSIKVGSVVVVFTTILCGQCGGEYVHDEKAGVWVCIEGSCLHTIRVSDLVLDEGETVCDWADVLGYFTTEAVA